MKAKILFLLACLTACQNGAVPIQSNTEQPMSRPEQLLLPSSASLTPPQAETHELSGASISGTTQLKDKNFSANNWGVDYLIGRVDATTPVILDYSTISGGPVVGGAYAWVGSRWESLGLQYHPGSWQNGKFTGSFSLPANTSHVAVLFYAFAHSRINASFQQAASSDSGTAALFSDAIRRSQNQLGSPTSSIYAASSPNILRQDFSNGVVLYRQNSARAYALYEPFWSAWKNSGQMTVYGLPVGDVQEGRSLSGKPSRFQNFEGANGPSLHSSALGTYRFYQQTRDVWNSGNNFDKLGHPMSHAENGQQSFEKGQIRNGQIISNGSGSFSGKRSADFKSAWQHLRPFNLAILDNGNASYNLTPAELIYYSAKENNLNPVLLIAKLQDEQSLIEQGKSSDPARFEWRLARACGLGANDGGDVNTYKYYGFFPQLVSASYQFDLYQSRDGHTFRKAYETYTSDKTKYFEFVNQHYPKYARKMNEITGKSYADKPSDNGYFRDFRDITIEHIQLFLNAYGGSLKEKDLFQQAPLSSDKVKYP